MYANTIPENLRAVKRLSQSFPGIRQRRERKGRTLLADSFSGGCAAAKPQHNHQKKECARDAVPRPPNVAVALQGWLSEEDLISGLMRNLAEECGYAAPPE